MYSANVGNILSWNIYHDTILGKGIMKGRWTRMRNAAVLKLKELVKLENEFDKKLKKLEEAKRGQS